MFLKEVVIHGFKSFADRISIALRPGITTIVGPNGCGKSNIVDAIRWVLGEQSAKALRGGNMQDVIFAGTETRKPMGFCEVSLLFSDCEDALGTAFHEVEILRRVARDGSSHYYLNGKTCRLKDIQRLFMDTGIGRVSYSFLVQGQIDSILSNNPAERRTIFEEAAGITKYKSQRQEALSKLDSVEQNLARVHDVLSELTKQTASLKRQATKAFRYKQIQHQLENLDLAHLSYQFSLRESSIKKLQEKFQALDQSVNQLKTDLKEKERALETKKAQRSEHYNQLQKNQENLFELRSQKEQTESQIKFSETRQKDFYEQIASLERDILGSIEEKSSITEKIFRESSQHEKQSSQLGSCDTLFQEKNKTLLATQQKLIQAENRIKKAKQDLLWIEKEIDQVFRESTKFESQVQSQTAQRSSIQEMLADVEKSICEQEMAIEKVLKKKISEKEACLFIQKEIDSVSSDLKTENEKLRAHQKAIQDSDRENTRLQAQMTILKELQVKLEGFSEGSKAILQNKLSDLIQAKDCRILAQCFEVDEIYRPCLELILGVALDAIAIENQTAIAAISHRLREKSTGRASLYIFAPYKPYTIPSNLPSSIRALSEYIQISPYKPELDALTIHTESLQDITKNDENEIEHFRSSRDAVSFKNLLSQESLLQGFFSGCYVTETLEEFLNYWKKNPEFSFLLAATKQGELIDCRGIIGIGGRSTAAKQPSFLKRKKEIQKLESAIERGLEELKGLQSKAETMRDRLSHLEHSRSKLQEDFSQKNQTLSILSSEERSLQNRLAQDRNIKLSHQKKLEELDQKSIQSQEAFHAVQEKLRDMESQQVSQRHSIDTEESYLESLRKLYDEQRDSLSEERIQLAQKKQELELLHRKMNDMKQKRYEIEQKITQGQQKIKEYTDSIGSLLSQSQTNKIALEAIQQSLESVTLELRTHQESLIAIEQLIREIEKQLSFERSRLQQLTQERTQFEVQLAREKTQATFLAERAKADYKIELKKVDWTHPIYRALEKVTFNVSCADSEDFAPLPALKIFLNSNPNVQSQETNHLQESFPAEGSLGADSGFFEKTSTIAIDKSRINIDGVGVDINWSAVERTIQELRSRIHTLGNVNLNAIEEYSELKERHDFLQNQSLDLSQSKEELLKAIADINQTTERLFHETFEKVRKHFAYTFDLLFGGGRADLSLLNADNVLESGIEIIAQPPGTKLRHLSLLSGGQKTMTALALLFAIYQVKPSPFCVLDELDAPLDDANIGRFTEMVKKFTEFSQFLIISHNKRTIATSDCIYGVTMQERGVTQLISIELSTMREKTLNPKEKNRV